MRLRYTILITCVVFVGCTTTSISAVAVVDGGEGAADARSDADAGAAGGASSPDADDGGSAIYDGPLDDVIPCPDEGFSTPCTSPPRVVYGCRCEEVHCLEGKIVPVPDSGPPCN